MSPGPLHPPAPDAAPAPQTPAEKLRAARIAAAAAGRCYSCRKRTPPPGQRNCEQCVDSSRASERKAREAAFQVCCQRSEGLHRFDCRESPRREAAVRARPVRSQEP